MTASDLKRRKATMIMGALRPEGEDAPRPARWRWWLMAAAAVVLLAVLAAQRIYARGEAGAETVAEEGVRSVNVVRPEPAGAGEVTLPATLRPNQSTDLYPRVDGYVRAWTAEIGTRVKAGQLVAEIDAPELDQEAQRAEAQVKQGEADLQQAKAELDEAKSDVALAASNLERANSNLSLATIQTQRVRRLVGTRAAAVEENDRTTSELEVRTAEKRAAEAELKKRRITVATRGATIRSREATLNSAKASLQRLRELQGFKRIVAPFDGVVSLRNAEVGMLVSAGASRAAPLFRVVQTDTLRAQVAVPQAFAANVRDGERVGLTVPERPGKTFYARVTRNAGEIDPASRTVTVEIELPNRDGDLLPGTYAQVAISGWPADGALLLPSAAVLMRPEGTAVAVVDGGAVRMRKVELGRDRGSKVEVLTGLSASDLVVASPSDDLTEGRRVRPVGGGGTPLAGR